MSTTISNVMDSEKRLLISMLITVQDKIKTTILCGTWLGGLYCSFIIRLDTLFLIAGHTKFGPDRCFGIIKKSYKVSYISSLYEFANMVESSNSGINKAQLVGTHDGTVIVPVYDWSSFLEQFFKKVPNIKKYHHFRFCKEEKSFFRFYINAVFVKKGFYFNA